jgi:hypothetical protein
MKSDSPEACRRGVVAQPAERALTAAALEPDGRRLVSHLPLAFSRRMEVRT